MNIFPDILPYLASVLTALAGFIGGRRAKAASDKKADAEAEQAEAEAKSREIDNNEKILKISQEYIVEPLQKEMKSLRRVVARLEKAIERTTDCQYKEKCPVRDELNRQKQEDEQ